jgi:hypothetical protein
MEDLQKMFPVTVKTEEETDLEQIDGDEAGTGDENLDVIYARVAKRKAAESAGRSKSQNKSVKSQLF